MAQIFRGRVVDVSDTTLTLCVSGDNGKVSSLWSAGRGVTAWLPEEMLTPNLIWCMQCLAAEKVMSKFGILEVARTGRICLKRGGLRLPVSQSAAQEGRHTKKVAADASRCGGGALPFTHKRKRSH